jgi:hypothetical protein
MERTGKGLVAEVPGAVEVGLGGVTDHQRRATGVGVDMFIPLQEGLRGVLHRQDCLRYGRGP